MLESRTQVIYEYICKYHAQYGMTPTQLEIRQACSVSSEALLDVLSILQARGQIDLKPRIRRGITLLEDHD